MKLLLPFLIGTQAAVDDCPSTECWTYNESTQMCSMKPECATLQCGATSFDVTFKSALFALEDNQPSGVKFASPFGGGVSAPAWDSNQWTKNILLDSPAMTYEIDTDTNE